MLHIIYRAYAGENRKGRPPYYDKMLSIMSLVHAARRLGPGVEIIYVSDGDMPEDRMRAMQASGEVLAHKALGMYGSMSTSFALARQRGWPAHDLVWFAEDDYLYQPHAFADLLAAAEAFPEADFFGLYALIGARRPDGAEAEDSLRIPRRWAGSEPKRVNGHAWQHALSTTHTFGARVGAFLANEPMMRYATRFGGAYDHATCLLYQGFSPYSARFLRHSFLDRSIPGGWLRRAAILGRRAWLNLYGTARIRLGARPAILVAPDPALITHCETAYMAQGTDWERVAQQTREWMAREEAAPR